LKIFIGFLNEISYTKRRVMTGKTSVGAMIFENFSVLFAWALRHGASA